VQLQISKVFLFTQFLRYCTICFVSVILIMQFVFLYYIWLIKCYLDNLYIDKKLSYTLVRTQILVFVMSLVFGLSSLRNFNIKNFNFNFNIKSCHVSISFLVPIKNFNMILKTSNISCHDFLYSFFS
jgi:hypothetical protein